MSISQISVFMESRPGVMMEALDVLAQAQVSIRGYCASDTGSFGVVRFVVNDTEGGLAALIEAGFAAKVTPVACVKLKDQPGELGRCLRALAASGINVQYSYSLAGTYVCLQVDGSLEDAEALLEQESLEVVRDYDLIV